MASTPTDPADPAGQSAPTGRTWAPTLDDAIAFAARIHTGQLDKAGEEYIGHPLRVMAMVARTAAPAGVDPQAVQFAAILHDVVEDSGTTLEDLAGAGYPAAVVAAVDALSHRPGESTRDYLARVATDPLAVVVKRADMQDNSDPTRLARLTPDRAARLADRYAGRRALLDDLVTTHALAREGEPGAIP